MDRSTRAALAVFGLVAFVSLVVFAGVTFARAVLPSQVVAVLASGGSQTCPRTGCTASTCHATQGGGADSYARAGDQASASDQGSTDGSTLHGDLSRATGTARTARTPSSRTRSARPGTATALAGRAALTDRAAAP
jgi:hypothetical protein